jgi:hypothetical protein
MFAIDKNIDDLDIRERTILKVFFSMNNHQVATPEMMLEEARSYVLFFREGKNRVTAYIALHLLLTDRKLYYAHSSNPFPNDEIEKVEEEALEFSEGLGAMLDELDFSKLSHDEKDSWIESQEIFTQKPEPEPEPEPEQKPVEAAPKETTPVQPEVTSTETPVVLSPQQAPGQVQSAPQQTPPAVPPVAPAPQQPAPVLQQAPPQQYIPPAQQTQQPPSAPPEHVAPLVQQPYQNPVQQPYQTSVQQPQQEQVVRYAPTVIYVPQPQPQAAPQQPYQSPPAPPVAQPPQQPYQAPVQPVEQQPAPFPPQASSYTTPPAEDVSLPPQQASGVEHQPDPRSQVWSSQETTQTRGPLSAPPDTRKAPRQQPVQKPVEQEPTVRQAKPASRTSPAIPAVPAPGKGRPGIMEQTVYAGIVKPQRSSAEKERKAAEGVVSRDREALARLLTSF